MPVELIDEARSRLLVWNDEPRDVIERLARKGLPYDVAEGIVSALAKEIRAKLAPHARFGGTVYLVIGVPMALFGAGMLYVYFRARSESDWRSVRFFGATLVGGVVLSVLGIVMTFTGLVRLISGSPPPG